MLLEKYGVSEIYAKVTSKYAVAYLNDKNTVLTTVCVNPETVSEGEQTSV